MWKDKLLHDLKAADQEAQLLTHDVKDGGTCNLDCVFLKLPRKREKTVLDIFRQAGISGIKTTWYAGPGYLISPNVGGRANRRTAGMEAMLKHLKNKGYDVFGYYQMD